VWAAPGPRPRSEVDEIVPGKLAGSEGVVRPFVGYSPGLVVDFQIAFGSVVVSRRADLIGQDVVDDLAQTLLAMLLSVAGGRGLDSRGS
jgi:hypothetical protein